MSKETLEKMFDKTFTVGLGKKAIFTEEEKIAVKKFIFDELLPEVLKSMLPDIENHICGFNDGEQRCECYLNCLNDIKQKIKELYRINL